MPVRIRETALIKVGIKDGIRLRVQVKARIWHYSNDIGDKVRVRVMVMVRAKIKVRVRLWHYNI